LNHRKKNRVRLYGAGGHAQIIKFILEQNGFTEIEAFDDEPELAHNAFKTVKKGFRQYPEKYCYDDVPFIISIGNNLQRAKIASFLKCSYIKAIHVSSTVSANVNIGEGTVVYAGAVIQPNTRIGKHVIINTMSSVDHDNILHDFVHISPKATLCGLVEIGEGSHIGAGAVIIAKIKIGKWCTIGAGTVVIKDVPDYTVVVGNPGRVIKIKKPTSILIRKLT
jgi:sugar O-acyltransferase (sialic acid O-acetyltransferase NeuD family)